jgi:hypothetical protein
VINAPRDKTLLFSGIGQYLKDYPNQVVLDRYQNQYGYMEGAIKLMNSDLLIPYGKTDSEVKLFTSWQNIILVDGNKIINILPQYQGK